MRTILGGLAYYVGYGCFIYLVAEKNKREGGRESGKIKLHGGEQNWTFRNELDVIWSYCFWAGEIIQG